MLGHKETLGIHLYAIFPLHYVSGQTVLVSYTGYPFPKRIKYKVLVLVMVLKSTNALPTQHFNQYALTVFSRKTQINLKYDLRFDFSKLMTMYLHY